MTPEHVETASKTPNNSFHEKPFFQLQPQNCRIFQKNLFFLLVFDFLRKLTKYHLWVRASTNGYSECFLDIVNAIFTQPLVIRTKTQKVGT